MRPRRLAKLELDQLAGAGGQDHHQQVAQRHGLSRQWFGPSGDQALVDVHAPLAGVPRDHAAKLGRTDDHQVAERPLEGLKIVLRGFPSCDAGPRAHARTTRDRGPRFLLTQQSHGVFRWSGWVSRPFAELAESGFRAKPDGLDNPYYRTLCP